MTTTLLDAFELLSHAEQLEPRLEAAVAALAKQPGLDEEKAWLASARVRLHRAREGLADLLTRVLRLSELESVRGERGRMLQGAVVDALDRLHSGIGFVAGTRAPLLDALYLKLKIPPLRKCGREEFERFYVDFEKRLGSTYARRMLADPDYAPLQGPLAELGTAYATWHAVFSTEPIAETEAEGLRSELESAARRLEVPCRQARLLGQASLLSLKELLETSGLAQRPKRRGPRDADEDTHPLLENDPPDPDEPSPDERAELAAVHAETTG